MLLARGLRCVAVLDVSGAALHRARARVGDAAAAPTWIEADVTADWSLQPVEIWHDRAVFHFLTSPDDRAQYLAHLQRTLKVHGSAVVATFGPDGPERCSGLPVARYSPQTLATEFGEGFILVDAVRYEHLTPRGSTQMFQYSRLLRVF
jgi:hypothetical protein